jgi:hypothetical protein
MVLERRVVLPAPGDAMTLTRRVPFFFRRSRIPSAVTSLALKIFCFSSMTFTLSISIKGVPPDESFVFAIYSTTGEEICQNAEKRTSDFKKMLQNANMQNLKICGIICSVKRIHSQLITA